METCELTKEKKEKLLDEKMAAMKRMNAKLEERHKEIEDDKKHAVHLSSTVQMQEVKTYIMKATIPRPNKSRPPIDQDNGENASPKMRSCFYKMLGEGLTPPTDCGNKFLSDPERDNVNCSKTPSEQKDSSRGRFTNNYRGGVYRESQNDSRCNSSSNQPFDRKEETMSALMGGRSTRSNYRGQKGKFISSRSNRGPTSGWGKRHAAYDQDSWRLKGGYHGDRNMKVEYDSWKTEQDGYDQQRIARSKKEDGQWRREWDRHKTDLDKNGRDVQSAVSEKQENPFARILKPSEANPFQFQHNFNDTYDKQIATSDQIPNTIESQIKSSLGRYLIRKSVETPAISDEVRETNETINYNITCDTNIQSTPAETNQLVANGSLAKTKAGFLLESSEESASRMSRNGADEVLLPSNNLNDGCRMASINLYESFGDESSSSVEGGLCKIPTVPDDMFVPVGTITPALIEEPSNTTTAQPVADPTSISIIRDIKDDIPNSSPVLSVESDDETTDTSAFVVTGDEDGITNTLEAVESPVSTSAVSPSPCSILQSSTDESKRSSSCLTDGTASPSDYSTASPMPTEEQVPIGIEETITSDGASSETSSIYEPVDEDFPSATVDFASTADAVLAATEVPSICTPESALNQVQESSDVSQKDVMQLSSPEGCSQPIICVVSDVD